MFHVFVNFDLNGTIIAGDEMGGKSPNKSILTDLLECYFIESAHAFVSSLNIQQLNDLLDAQFGVSIGLQKIIEDNTAQFHHSNFYENFKTLLSLCIKQTGVNIKQNDMLKYFLQTEKMPNNQVASMVMERILAQEEIAQNLKETVSQFHHYIDDAHILRSFYTYIHSIKEERYTHVTLNTFGNEAPKVVDKVSDTILCSKQIIVENTTSIEAKRESAKTLFQASSTSKLIIQQSNFKQYDENGRTNKNGKLFPINADKKGLYVFFDDNLSFNGLNDKGCVNIFDVSTAQDVDFSTSPAFVVENESPDIKAVICGNAIVVLVRARLSNTSSDSYFVDTVNRWPFQVRSATVS